MLVEGALLSGVTLVGWIGAFHVTTHSFTRYLKSRKWEMSRQHILNMSEAVVSGLQSVVSSVCGVLVVVSCGHNVMRARHSLSTQYAWVMASYFLYDTWAMYQVHLSSLKEGSSSSVRSDVVGRLKSFMQRRTLLILHHLVLAFILVPILIYRDGIGDFFVGCFYCVELSGPFTNMRVVLSRLGLKNTRWYTANGILMITTFTCCRVLVFPYMYLCYGSQHGLGLWGVVRSIPLHCNLGCLLILLPQIHWIRLMVRGALKISRGQHITEAEEKID
ncbi:hypothetical protein Pcinc_009149 [Petrolisthes cinctipes]|uniref:TLC domain-containing protein n=1 Tax=Petrolisthes cinctipes TaxID=88211 RepID=A0AAE1KWL9_PETCI|nr:hypothetical protein Pcinc_009149 [Petrolisthes cinctipes]